jgi:CHAT domain-containing protein
MDLDGAEMAFLSACGTARPAPAVLDEVVHLASTFGVADYPYVLATLWEVSDRSAAYISEHFYRGLAERENSIAAAAASLHGAVPQLREDLPDRPSQWAAHIH